MADYNSNYTGQEIDEAVGAVLSPDVFLFVATASNDLSDYAFSHTLEEISEAVDSGKAIVCIVKHMGKVFSTFVEHSVNSLSVSPVVDSSDLGYTPRVFTINWPAGSYTYSILADEPKYILPYASMLQVDNYTVPMIDFMYNNLGFATVNEKADLQNSLEQLILGAMSLTDVATVITDPTFVEGTEYIADRVCRNMKAGRGSIAYQTISTLGNITIMGAFTGAQEVYSGNDELGEIVMFANIDVFVGGSSGGVYNSVETYHGTATVAVKYESGSAASVAAAIHLDHHTPTIM